MLPLVDVAPLLADERDERAAGAVAGQLDDACRRFGFVRITGHGILREQLDELIELSREFFALPDNVKARIAMARAGPAWRGWFPVGGELTSGRPDGKEGIYFGEQHPPDHPRVLRGVPLHGANLFPAEPAGLGDAVLRWMAAMTSLSRTLLGALAVGLGLDEDWFERHVTGGEPTVLFRIFHYPSGFGGAGDWGVGEHTDYGLLTILAQDGTDGMQVHGPEANDDWIDVPGDREVLVVNLGDMLERMTSGRYRSTPHRVRNESGTGRLSFPFFCDPCWDATVTPMPVAGPVADLAGGRPRWDGADVSAWEGTYGEYLTTKVSRVFPALFDRVSRRPGP